MEDILKKLEKQLRKKPTTVDELAGLLHTSVRTVYRYLHYLIAKGVPVIRIGVKRPVRYSIGA